MPSTPSTTVTDYPLGRTTVAQITRLGMNELLLVLARSLSSKEEKMAP